MVIKAYILALQSIESVYEAILKTCDELGLKITNSRKNEEGSMGYQIEGKTGLLGRKFVIIYRTDSLIG
jgi:hypothetical protein